MELKEISLAQLLNNTSGTDYFAIFAKLIGHSEDAVFYEGIGDDELNLVEELESMIESSLPSNYMEFLSYLNGGHFLDVDLFSIADKEFPNSLVARNFISKIRKELELEDKELVIGRFDNYIIYVDCEGNHGSYTLMDIRNNEKLEFESIGALIGFIYYMLILKENKKIEEEKVQINEMKEKLHNDFKKRNVEIKKESIKNRDKLMARVAAKGLREKLKKNKKK